MMFYASKDYDGESVFEKKMKTIESKKKEKEGLDNTAIGYVNGKRGIDQKPLKILQTWKIRDRQNVLSMSYACFIRQYFYNRMTFHRQFDSCPAYFVSLSAHRYRSFNPISCNMFVEL